MKNLIIGASGQIGSYLIDVISPHEEVIGTYNTKPPNHSGNKYFNIDALDFSKVKRLISEVSPNYIFVTAAQTNVDICEECNKNTLIIKNLVDAINSLNVKNNFKKYPLIIFYSTDHVFDGTNSELYTEKNLPNPINKFGQQKLISEHYLATNYHPFLIIRTTNVFSERSRFIENLLLQFKNNQKIYAPTDEISTPTYAPNLASISFDLIKNIGFNLKTFNSQIINIAGSKKISKFDFIQEFADIFNFDSSLIKSVKSKYLNRKALRPLNGGLSNKLLESKIERKMISSTNGIENIKRNYVN